MNISDQGYNIVDMVTLNKTLGVEELNYWQDFRDKPMTDSGLRNRDSIKAKQIFFQHLTVL